MATAFTAKTPWTPRRNSAGPTSGGNAPGKDGAHQVDGNIKS